MQRSLLEFTPVSIAWQAALLSTCSALSLAAVWLSAAPLLLKVAFTLAALAIAASETATIRRTPQLLQRYPGGRWRLLYTAPKPVLAGKNQLNYQKSQKKAVFCRLERHFFAGSRSIALLLSDEQARWVLVWLFHSGCRDDAARHHWRRLSVLLRWPL